MDVPKFIEESLSETRVERLRVLLYSKFVLIAPSLVTNAIVIIMLHCSTNFALLLQNLLSVQ